MRKVNKGLKKAFTLVEILIVVVILGILAAIVIPQFTNATQDAQGGNLRAQLASLQNQIELYRARNNNAAPITTAAANWNLLITGNYIKAAPVNPAHPGAAAAKSAVTVATTTGDAASGWVYNATTNTLFASFFNETTGAVSTTGTD